MILSKGVHWISLFVILLGASCWWQSVLLGAAQGSQRKIARAVRVDGSPQLDGDLSEALWNTAPAVSEFLQRDPREGEAATENTEVKIIYNDTAIFFGVVCYDSEPERILATERARDGQLQSDDTFEIILDTFHNHQDGFLFRTNPLATKFDSWITDEGRRENRNWDERWRVAAKRNEVGWVAEIEIPFKSIRMPDEEKQVWGIDFKRAIRRKNEEAIWSNYRRDFGFNEVSQAGDLIGLEDISSELRLRIKPYLTAGASRVFRRGQPETDHLFDVGLEDVKYRLTPSLTLDFTANPDFAQADVDEQISNLTRFSVFFPEKREFFQENASLFDFGPGGFSRELRLFHSRTIGLSASREPIDILAGVKLTGQIKGLDLGFINAQTDDFNDNRGSNFTVLRIRKKLLSRSVVGAMVTNRQSSLQNDFNRVFGVDGNFVFFDNLHLESFFAGSRTPGVEEDDWLARPLRISWDTDFLSVSAEHTIIGRNFNAEMGFVPRTDMNKSVLDFEISPRPGGEWIRQLEFGASVDYITNQEDVLETREQELGFGMEFESGDGLNISYSRNFEFLDEGFRLRGRIPIPPGSYDSNAYRVNFIAYRGRKVSGFFSYQRENGFWDGNRTTLNLNPRVRWSQNLSIQIQYRADDIELPFGELSSKVSNVEINYNFTNNWLTSTTLQYDSIQDEFVVNFRLNWIYRPGDDLFVVYNQEGSSGQYDRAIILKFTHSFDF
ncbi:carbohydrate binding family 9 domain-containing protein [Acidobacteria bacterium AH-259-D05]|nr:carbohydrate binding family 9 domain-containing protein [Acidobacteria bacterium AH-259-D05]